MLLSAVFLVIFGVYNVHSVTLLRGNVRPENEAYLSDNLEHTTLHVKIEDVSLQDAASVVLSARSIKLTSGKKFPIYFEIVYPKAIVDEVDGNEHRYAISASIVSSVANELLYTTDKYYALPKQSELGASVSLTLIKIKENELFDRENCKLSPESGSCLAFFEKYYFDSDAQKCKKFIWGGCEGNLNRFDSEKECLAHCLPRPHKPEEVAVAEKTTDICSLESEAGPCKALFPRFYYVKELNQCKEFIYGGCRGNENNFRTYEACMKTCYKK